MSSKRIRLSPEQPEGGAQGPAPRGSGAPRRSPRPGANGPMRPMHPVLLLILLLAVLFTIWYLRRLS